MKAVVFREGSTWAVEEVERPTPGEGEALLKVLRTGVCGTDEHLLHGGFIAKLPLIPGHEMLGEVVELGPNTPGPAVGTKVVVDNTLTCGECGSCGEGKPLFCENFVSLGCNEAGGFAEYVLVRAGKTFDIGDLDPDVAVFTEPTACAMHGVDILALKPASHVLIFGAGPTGLILSQLVRMAGASRVTVAAPTQSKLDLAKKYGADNVVKLDRNNPQAALPELRAIAPRGFDAIIEATAAIGVFEMAVGLTKTGGTLMAYGVYAEDALARVSPAEIFSRELRIQGSFAQTNCIGRALDALQTGRIKTEGLATTVVGLSDFDKALANLHDSEQVKTVVDPSRG